MDFTFVRSGPSYMHCCRAFPLRLLGFLVYFPFTVCVLLFAAVSVTTSNNLNITHTWVLSIRLTFARLILG